nr:immunoglobulin heavy chain junction region [Mus musculus]MBK4197112.1 immunoglobulin heavy chain junction region [Mus musculus]MBK4197113.1 immunoglobulin heavy chain junction region [Mus musculus]MBK4197114.1 immunoglobulin heavy chain junction region [Mus musculus]MBK4197115.1 immunoglobulin heavy chain junction region [Mus musculus]
CARHIYYGPDYFDYW